jgi:hypothetical protein
MSDIEVASAAFILMGWCYLQKEKIGTGGGKRIYIETEVLMVHGTYLIF